MYYSKIINFMQYIYKGNSGITLPKKVSDILTVQLGKDFSESKGSALRYSNSLMLRTVEEECPQSYTRYQLLQTPDGMYHLIFFTGKLNNLRNKIFEDEEFQLKDKAALWDEYVCKCFVTTYNLIEALRGLSYEHNKMTIADKLTDRAPLIIMAAYNMDIYSLLVTNTIDEITKYLPVSLNCIVDSMNTNRESILKILTRISEMTEDGEINQYLYGSIE